jgi:capsular polysaccharide biosynthesis protein
MALVETIRQLWQRKLLVGIVLALAVAAAIFSAYRVSPSGLESRSLAVAAASSQILVDSPDSTLVQGAELGTFEALATRAKIYGQYLASLDARQEIAKQAGVPARSIATSGPFSSATGQSAYSSQTSEERAGELLQEGAQNRLVFTAQEGVPILTVDAQSASSETAIALAGASFTTLENYVKGLEADGKPVRQGVTVRELGAPEGGTLGGSNNMILMVLAFLLVLGLGCAAILLVPTFAQRWRALNDVEYADAELDHDRRGPVDIQDAPSHGYDPTPLANGEPRDHIAPHPAPSR